MHRADPSPSRSSSITLGWTRSFCRCGARAATQPGETVSAVLLPQCHVCGARPALTPGCVPPLNPRHRQVQLLGAVRGGAQRRRRCVPSQSGSLSEGPRRRSPVAPMRAVGRTQARARSAPAAPCARFDARARCVLRRRRNRGRLCAGRRGRRSTTLGGGSGSGRGCATKWGAARTRRRAGRPRCDG